MPTPDSRVEFCSALLIYSICVRTTPRTLLGREIYPAYGVAYTDRSKADRQALSSVSGYRIASEGVLGKREATATCELLRPRRPNQRLRRLDLRGLLELFACFFLSHGLILPRFACSCMPGVVLGCLNRKGCPRRGRQPDSRSYNFLATPITLSSSTAWSIRSSWTSSGFSLPFFSPSQFAPLGRCLTICNWLAIVHFLAQSPLNSLESVDPFVSTRPAAPRHSPIC